MNNDIYQNTHTHTQPLHPYITKLCDLFDHHLYIKQILPKHTTKTPPDLIFKKRDNTETKFIINFISNTIIEVTIPLKYKNYLYTTNFTTQPTPHNPPSNILTNIYEYLKYHISLH